MSFRRTVPFLLFFLAFAVFPVKGETKGTFKEEAQSMVESAVALIKADGPDKAFEKIQSKDGGFIRGDLYVYVLDKNGIFMAHGAMPALVGKGGMEMKDVNGFSFIKAIMNVKDKEWINYKWADFTDGNKIKSKSSYVVRVGDYVVAAGFYHE